MVFILLFTVFLPFFLFNTTLDVYTFSQATMKEGASVLSISSENQVGVKVRNLTVSVKSQQQKQLNILKIKRHNMNKEHPRY